MNTPQEFGKIAVWMGWGKRHRAYEGLVWIGADKTIRGGIGTKTSLTDAECMEVLNRLHDKELPASLTNAPCVAGGRKLDIWLGDCWVSSGYQPTINQAVEQALLKLIASEGGKE